jgi:hypothetical protein
MIQDSGLFTLAQWHKSQQKVARFFLVQQTKMANNKPTWTQKYIPNRHKTYQNGNKIPNDK